MGKRGEAHDNTKTRDPWTGAKTREKIKLRKSYEKVTSEGPAGVTEKRPKSYGKVTSLARGRTRGKHKLSKSYEKITNAIQKIGTKLQK